MHATWAWEIKWRDEAELYVVDHFFGDCEMPVFYNREELSEDEGKAGFGNNLRIRYRTATYKC